MRKVFLTILIGCMGLIPGHASNNAISQEEMLSIPARPTYLLTYDQESSTLFLSVRPKGAGSLVAVLRNLTTGESFTTPVSHHEALFHITGEAGIWRLDLWSANRQGQEIISTCDFMIDNGMIVYL